jgi:hypothetical protein
MEKKKKWKKNSIFFLANGLTHRFFVSEFFLKKFGKIWKNETKIKKFGKNLEKKSQFFFGERPYAYIFCLKFVEKIWKKTLFFFLANSLTHIVFVSGSSKYGALC